MDFDTSLDYVNWYFDNAKKYLSPEITFENNKEIHQVFHEPIGVVAVIIPWNFPFANFIWGTLQSLIAGNTIVLKHSEKCALCGKFIEDVFTRHLPKGVFGEVYGGGNVGKLLVQQNIDMIVFTGSTKTGKFLYETAGKKFIKSIMELGGSAPGIIFSDADIELSIGNAEDKNTEIGPLVSDKQLELLKSQVEDAKIKGAEIITGGNSLEQKMNGAFFEPTILINITQEMKVWQEEVFGPVLPVIKFKTEQDAISYANQTIYGLGSYIFTKDKEKAERVASLIKTGMVSINGTNYIKPFNPFGGYKNSGFGREHGKYGFHEVIQIKIVAKNK